MVRLSSDEEKTKTTWGSWEELVLACAVKRHGFNNWDSVSMEVQGKTCLPHPLTTAECCKLKYQDLKRRFKDEEAAVDNNNNHHIPWLEQLRKVRVDELKREVQRYDVSIFSLQLKVNKLEEEREGPDLENAKTCLLNDTTEEPQKSDRENRSVNESNSTGLRGGLLAKIESEPVRSGAGEDPILSGSKVAEELGDSVTQLSSDVQSSASFGTKRNWAAGGADAIIKGTCTGTDAKSEPLIRLLDFIRTHNHASLFERRHKTQEWNKYKEVIRQHVDLETIQTRVEGGSYSACILTFYRDLLLLFNNAIVYFPKSSLESETAHQLRSLVSYEIKKDSSQEQAPPLLAKHKPSAPIIVCGKRNSVDDTKKPATEVNPQPLARSLLKVKTEEKPIVTGVRSSRSSRNLTSNTPIPTPPAPKKKQNASAQGSKGVDKRETSKTDNKKKNETLDKKKSVVDFLKRIKKNSPVQTVKKSKGGEEQKKSNNNGGKKERILLTSADKKQAKEESSSPSKRSVGRPPKKVPEASTVSGKRGRESGGKEFAAAHRQSKRARR